MKVAILHLLRLNKCGIKWTKKNLNETAVWPHVYQKGAPMSIPPHPCMTHPTPAWSTSHCNLPHPTLLWPTHSTLIHPTPAWPTPPWPTTSLHDPFHPPHPTPAWLSPVHSTLNHPILTHINQPWPTPSYLDQHHPTLTHPNPHLEHFWAHVSPFSWGGPQSLPFGRQKETNFKCNNDFNNLVIISEADCSMYQCYCRQNKALWYVRHIMRTRKQRIIQWPNKSVAHAVF